MDTPKRNQIGTPFSRFEDSPVYSFMNNLSPINTGKVVPSSQPLDSLYISPPPVFRSPNLNRYKESRFLRSHNDVDASKLKALPEEGKKIVSGEEALADSTHAYHKSSELQPGNANQRIPLEDRAVEPSNEHSNVQNELPLILKFDCGNPSRDPPPGGDKTDVAYVNEAYKLNSCQAEALPLICDIKPRIEGSEYNWDVFLPDATTNMFTYYSPNQRNPSNDLMQKSFDPTGQFSNLMSQLPHTTLGHEGMRIVDPVASASEHEIGDHPFQRGEAIENGEVHNSRSHTAGMSGNLNVTLDNQLVPNTRHGMRRRCLDFEMVGGRRKNFNDDSNNSNSSTLQSDERNVASDSQLLPAKPNDNQQRTMFPTFGLHLNALATSATSKDYKSLNNENISSGRQLSLPSPALQQSSSQEHCLPSVPVTAEGDSDVPDSGVHLAENCSQPSGYAADDEFNQNNPKKKRRNSEAARDGESCKRCNCKKSKCLKLYCECFAAGVYCIEPCACLECMNKPINEDTVITTRKQIESRNALAFAPKVIRSADSAPENGHDPNTTPASARHKRGCNCKKSSCSKKYCECYQAGVGCSIGCRCEGCKNSFGRKDGSDIKIDAAEPEEEPESSEKTLAEKSLQNSEIQNNDEHPESTLPMTPLCISSSLLPLSFSSNGKPPRPSFITTIPASGLYANQKLGQPSNLVCQPNLEKQFEPASNDEMPEILRGDGSSGIKTSPNGKRVLSPNVDTGSSPGLRAGRKLILQSIPSFPSLSTPHH